MDDALFHRSLHMVAGVVRQVKNEDMTKPTPCSEWDVHALVNHLLNEVAWVEPLLEGKTIDEVGGELNGDLVSNDTWAAWQKYCTSASKAVLKTAPDEVAHLSYADKPAEDYVKEVAADILVHGWDLAQALGVGYELDDGTIALVTETTKDTIPMAREAGMIGKRAAVPKDASALDRLLAEYGRSVNWRQQ